MPKWFNIKEQPPTATDQWIEQWSCFEPKEEDWNRSAAGIGHYLLNTENEKRELHPAHAFPEVLFAFAGEGILREGSRMTKIREGDMFFVTPGQAHLIWTTSKDPELTVVCFKVTSGEPGPWDKEPVVS